MICLNCTTYTCSCNGNNVVNQVYKNLIKEVEMKIVDLSDDNVKILMKELKGSINSTKEALDLQHQIVDDIEIIYGKLDEVVKIIGKNDRSN